MPQPPVDQSVNPSDPTTKLPGKPPRQDDVPRILRDLSAKIKALEDIVSGGILFTSPDGSTTMRLTIDNSGAPVWTRQ